MTLGDISDVFAYIESLWPSQIKEPQRLAMRPTLERLNMNAYQARAALSEVVCTHKGYITPAHIIERMKAVAYANTPTDQYSKRAEERARIAAERADHEAEIAEDDRRLLAWVETLDQSDVDAMVEWTKRHHPLAYTAFVSNAARGRDAGPLQLADARTSRMFRYALSFANREMAGGAV